MTFDEQLQRSLLTVSDRLRDQIAGALLAAGADVTAHANEAREAAVQEASARARADAEASAQVETARLERRMEEMNEASASLARGHAADVAACERLVDAVRALDRASSLSDILNALVDGASHEAARVGLLLVRNGELRGWRFTGFGPALEPARSVAIRAEEHGIIAEAMRTGVAVSSDAAGALAAPAFAELPGDRDRLAVPVIVSGDVAAVLYADQGSGEPTDGRSSSLKWPAASGSVRATCLALPRSGDRDQGRPRADRSAGDPR